MANGRYEVTYDIIEEGNNLRKRLTEIVDESKKLMADSAFDMESDEFLFISKTYRLIGDSLRYMKAYETKIMSIDSKLDRILEKLEEK